MVRKVAKPVQAFFTPAKIKKMGVKSNLPKTIRALKGHTKVISVRVKSDLT